MKTIYTIFLTYLFVFSSVINGKDYVYTTENNTEDVKENVPSDYKEKVDITGLKEKLASDWEVATLQGKLKMEELPLSPTLKIFMKKDSLINISVRAPFVGEAGRMIITRDSVLAVNKLNKTYCIENISTFLELYPGGMENVQDLLLARFFLPGINLNEVEIESVVDLVYEDGQYNAVPKGEAIIEGVRYGYALDEEFDPLALVVFPKKRPNLEVDAIYNYNTKGYDLSFYVQDGNQALNLTLELKEPEWEGEEPKPIDISKKFRQVGISEFLRVLM